MKKLAPRRCRRNASQNLQDLSSNIALSAAAFVRMVVVVTTLIAWSEREWLGIALSLFVFGLTTYLIGKVLNMPDTATIEELTAAIDRLTAQGKKE